MATPPSNAEIARAYHQTTYHRPDRYARALGYMDWETQPDPFRRFDGAALVELPFGGAGPVAKLLELSLGLTAWKSFEGSRWALRANPSSGNLHATEAYVVTAGGAGIPAGVLHYAPREHALELRCSLPQEAASSLGQLIGKGSFLVGLSTVLWREAWKYGERSFRYVALDIGHVLGALEFAAAALGLHIEVLSGVSDADIGALLGLDRTEDFAEVDAWEHEVPELLVRVSSREERGPDILGQALIEALAMGTWHGQANVLSAEHHEWDVIFATAAATRSGGWEPRALAPGDEPNSRSSFAAASSPAELEALIRKRRSAQSLNGLRTVDLGTFERLLAATLPDAACAPWRGGALALDTHLVVFLHRVEGLVAGLYILLREPSSRAELQAALHPDFAWQAAPVEPKSALFGRLFLLKRGDCQAVARTISCTQDIAADGIFSLGMLCRFADRVEEDASAYRRLFWSCGLIGQALYLAAEAEGLRGTGIGCYLDPLMHQLLGLGRAGHEPDAWQVLYHFTIGEAVDDERLETLPPYAHLERATTG